MSRAPGFHQLTPDARVQRAAALMGFEPGVAADLARLRGPSFGQLLVSSENVVSSVELPLSLAPNFVVNGVPVLVPMSTEEPSVVAAAGRGATLLGDVDVDVPRAQLWGQLQLMFPDLETAASARSLVGDGALSDFEVRLLGLVNATIPGMTRRGGGIRTDSGTRPLAATLLPQLDCGDAGDGPVMTRCSLTLRFLFQTCAALGANAVNGALEAATASICEAFRAELKLDEAPAALLRIMSNLCPERLCTARALIPYERLGEHGREVAQRLCEASALAEGDSFRQATHNKGVMNGVIAVGLATGQDTRALWAGAASFAGPFTSFLLTPAGLQATACLPLLCGTVGGAVALPSASLGLRILSSALLKAGRPGDADALAEFLPAVMIAVGLANNLSALLALVSGGIQQGHMRLHAANLLAQAEVPPENRAEFIERVVAAARRDNVPISMQLVRDVVGALDEPSLL